jgi:monoamine oxidase
MSRSAMMRRVRTVLAAQIAEIDPRLAPIVGRMGRRQFMQVGAAALAGEVMPLQAAMRTGGVPAAPRRPARVGIVGGGIAGLVGALTLHEAGQACTVFEASTRSGGRMHSLAGWWPQGQTSEWGGEFIDTQHLVLRGLARRFGLPLDDVNRAYPPNSRNTAWFLGGYYRDAELVADLQPVSRVLARQIAAVGSQYRWNNHNRAAHAFDRMSCYDWIENFVPGGHASRLGLFFDVGMVTLNGLDTPQQSALNIIIPSDSDERYHVRGGNERIPQAIADRLPAGTLRTGWRLAALSASAGDAVTLAFDTPNGPRTETFDRVILALPFSVLRELDLREAGFDERKRAMIDRFGYGTNAKLCLQFDSRYWNGRGAWPGIASGATATDIGFQSTWETSLAQPGEFGLLTNYTGGAAGAAFDAGSPYTDSLASPVTAAYANDFLAQLETLWPGITPRYNGLATLSDPSADSGVKASYSAFGVGQYTAFCGYGGVPQRRVHFAGEHTSVRFLGYMEGGAQTGLRAAREVLAAIRAER